MFDFNSIGIKSDEDLQEALQVEMEPHQFVFQVKGMIDRWGIDSTLSSLGNALCGNKEEGMKPLIKFTHYFEHNEDNYNDPILKKFED